MDTAQQVLEQLQQAVRPLSGNQLAGQLKLSRTAVWKAVNKLRRSGIAIEGRPNSGYSLTENKLDALTVNAVRCCLSQEAASRAVISVIENPGSTNEELLKASAAGAPNYSCLIAPQQSAGRGRRGRAFYSPAGGLYLSMLLRPHRLCAADCRWLTITAAVAACEAVEELNIPDLPPVKIKWLNDLFINERKVCGILCESTQSIEDEYVSSVVVGAGFNLYPPEDLSTVPPDLKGRAYWITDRQLKDGRARLAALFINHLLAELLNFNKESIVRRYQERSCLIGRQVEIHSEDSVIEAQVIDIDAECRLNVRFKDGTRAKIRGGEVSLRPLPLQEPEQHLKEGL